MKKIYLGSVIIGIFFVSSCATLSDNSAGSAASQQVPTAALSPIPPKDGKYSGKGKITKINKELNSVELDHEEIPDLMPAMIMEFYVSDKWLLTGLKVGDNVDFIVQYEHPSEKIVSITKIK